MTVHQLNHATALAGEVLHIPANVPALPTPRHAGNASGRPAGTVKPYERKRGKGKPMWLGGYASLPRVFYETKEYRALSSQARSLLVEYALRFKGDNNGDLEMTEEQFSLAGLGTPTTFQRYKAELINAGWIVVTRQGGLGRCSLYALTYLPIDRTGKPYDHPFKAGGAPSHLWREENRSQRDIRKEPSRRNRLTKFQPAQQPNLVDTEPRGNQGHALGVQ